MNKIFEITIPMRATQKKNNQRILRRANGSPFIAQNARSKSIERMISMMVSAQAPEGPPSEKGICFYTVAVFRIPKTGKNKGKKEGDMYLIRPDASNIDNLLHDALEGIIYLDDQQIGESITRKIWGEKDEIHIKVYEE